MAQGSFTSPSGAPPKSKIGKVNRPKSTHSARAGSKQRDPLRFASASIPSCEQRRKRNHKTGFHT